MSKLIILQSLLVNYVILLALTKVSSSCVFLLPGGNSMYRWGSVVIACNSASEIILLVPERLGLYGKSKYERFCFLQLFPINASRRCIHFTSLMKTIPDVILMGGGAL